MQKNSGDEHEQGKREEPYKKFVMVNHNQGLDIPPLQARHMTPPTPEPRDKGQKFNQVNNVPLIDQYVVNISDDELYKDNYSLDYLDEDDETSEALIKPFNP